MVQTKGERDQTCFVENVKVLPLCKVNVQCAYLQKLAWCWACSCDSVVMFEGTIRRRNLGLLGYFLPELGMYLYPEFRSQSEFLRQVLLQS